MGPAQRTTSKVDSSDRFRLAANSARRARVTAVAMAVLLAAGSCRDSARLTGSGDDPDGRLAADTGRSLQTTVAANPALIDLARVELVDLTHPLGPDSLYWPTGAAFEFERVSWGRNESGDWYAAARFATPEHLGTHLDAPIHFAEGAWTSEQIPVDAFVGPGAVIDISERAAGDPDATLRESDIEG